MPIITEAELRERIRRPKRGMKVAVPPGTRFSPSARDFIGQWGLEIVVEEVTPPAPPETSAAGSADGPAWDKPSAFPVRPIKLPEPKPEHMTQLDAEHFAPKNIPRIRFRGKMDSVQGLTQLTAARARSFQLSDLARHLDTLAAYCREIVSAEYNGREVAPIAVAGLDEAALRDATHHPRKALGIPHLTPGPDDHEMLHWLNYLRAQVREAELAALDAFAPPPAYEPTRLDLIRALNRLSSAVYYLELLFKAGKLSWHVHP
jgi:ethanolamine utilization cobalamin adenosyltransferase